MAWLNLAEDLAEVFGDVRVDPRGARLAVRKRRNPEPYDPVRAARYRAANRDAINAYHREWRAKQPKGVPRAPEDPEKVRARRRAYYARNRERILAKARAAFALRDVEAHRAAQRAAYARDREKILAKRRAKGRTEKQRAEHAARMRRYVTVRREEINARRRELYALRSKRGRIP